MKSNGKTRFTHSLLLTMTSVFFCVASRLQFIVGRVKIYAFFISCASVVYFFYVFPIKRQPNRTDIYDTTIIIKGLKRVTMMKTFFFDSLWYFFFVFIIIIINVPFLKEIQNKKFYVLVIIFFFELHFFMSNNWFIGASVRQ